MDLNKLRAPHLPVKPWDTALERRKILQVIFKPTISLVPVSLFALSPARPPIGSSTILMQPRQQQEPVMDKKFGLAQEWEGIHLVVN